MNGLRIQIFYFRHSLDINASKGSEVILNLDKHHGGRGVRKLDFLTPEKLVTVAKTVKIYDLNTAQFIRKLENKENTKIYSLKAIDQNVFFTGDDVGTLKMFDLRTSDKPLMDVKEHEDYLSDMDIDYSNKILLTTSGDGHLSAFNIKTKKLILQSEPFDSGFQSVRYLGHRNKVIVGAEDGALNIFNVGEWGNISDRFPLDTSKRSYGNCSVDGLQIVNERLVIASSSDGKIRLVQMFPNKILHTVRDHKNSIESLDFNSKLNLVISTESDNVFVHKLIDDDVDEADEADSQKNDGEKSKGRKSKATNSFFADL